ncbi:DsbE family thiol:disulfide interchange protein [Echinimonas agarilytica]|uniref:DsbE family thiol:disulfide interchange protein n=1 Tax=Echinimonas agarilytica TaxID=1215918 RepID=A0AA41W5H3_9GAMM|nr:DsbE family thiol:disulfide interchange protein [Echinimonas agarilytica]MCM2679004.1 DsbE family thiol:disulfide interchange protein [Echinimonas agarilytica]
MNKRLILLVPLACFLFVGAFFYTALFSDPRELESALVGKPVPEFELPDLLNPSRQLTKQSFGEGHYLINVWATWCPTCRAEHEYLNKLAKLGVKIVGINYKDEPAKARVWLEQLGDPYVLNVQDYKGDLAIDLGVYGAPETYVVDTNGIIVYRHVGDVNERVWRDKLAEKYREAGEVNEL